MKSEPGIGTTLKSALRDWWDDWVQWLVLSVIWILCWLTILLGPPATFALVYAAHQIVEEGQTTRLRDLVGVVREYAAISWLWMVINILVVGVAAFNLLFYSGLRSPFREALLWVFGFLVFMWWCVQFYTVPYIFQMERRHLGLALRNGLYTTLAAPLYTLVVAGLALVLMVLAVGAVGPLILGIPGLVAVLGVRAVSDRLHAFGLRKEPQEEEETSNAGEETPSGL